MKNKVCKKLIISSIISAAAFWFTLMPQGAFCYTLTNSEIVSIVNQKVNLEIKEQLKPYLINQNIKENDYKITITGIPYNDITIAQNEIPKIEIQSQNQGQNQGQFQNRNQDKTFQKNQIKRVVVKNSKDIIVKSFPINVQTLVYADVLSAKSIINYGDEISLNNTDFVRKEVSNCLDRIITKSEYLESFQKGNISKRNYQKGSMILSDSIKEKSVISKNSIVDIIFLSEKGIKIKLQGHALKDGSIGDTILVRSDKYNKIYNAKVNSANEVTVRI